MDEVEDLYGLLHVDPAADTEVIRAAYRALVQKYHPDRNSSPKAADMMKRLNHAYEVLNDPAKRSEYDRRRSAGPMPPAGAQNAYTWRMQLSSLQIAAITVLIIALVLAFSKGKANPRIIIIIVALAVAAWALYKILKKPEQK